MFTKVLYIHTCFWIIESPSKLPQLPCEKKSRWKKSSDERRCRQRCRLSLTFSRSILAATATRKKVRKLCSLPICFYSAVLCREISSTALNLINNIHMTTGIWKSAAAVEGWNESFKFSCYCSSDMRFLKTLGMMLLWFLLHWPN